MQKKSRHEAGLATLVNDLMLAPMVAMMRLPIMASEAQGLSPWRGESARAVSEKVKAATEGAVAAQLSMMRSMAGFWPEIMAGQVPSIYNGVAVERSMHAALLPAGRKVKANYRRLSEK